MIQIKRAYEPPSRADGRRILVERLWPRGVKKEALGADSWLKDVAPSTELRKWFAHRPERWEEFRRRYREELEAAPAVELLLSSVRETPAVTLLYSAHDEAHNSAIVLRDYLIEKSGRARSRRASRRRGLSAGATACGTDPTPRRRK